MGQLQPSHLGSAEQGPQEAAHISRTSQIRAVRAASGNKHQWDEGHQLIKFFLEKKTGYPDTNLWYANQPTQQILIISHTKLDTNLCKPVNY